MLWQPARAGTVQDTQTGRTRPSYRLRSQDAQQALLDQYSIEGFLVTAALFLASGSLCMLYRGAEERGTSGAALSVGLIGAAVGTVAYGYLWHAKMMLVGA